MHEFNQRICISKCRKPLPVHAKKTYIYHTLLWGVVARDEARTRRLTAPILHGSSPQGEQSPLLQSPKCKRRNPEKNFRNRARKTTTEGLIWPFVKAEKSEEQMVRSQYKETLKNVEDGIRAISQWIGMILYSFRQSGRSQSVLALCSVEWIYEREPGLYTSADY